MLRNGKALKGLGFEALCRPHRFLIRCNHHQADPPAWPKRGNPTPYEIFGMSKTTFDKEKLKHIYVKLAKIYHPDSHGKNDNNRIASHLPRDVRLDRFKKIVSAYNTLRDDSRRKEYDMSVSQHYYTTTNAKQYYNYQQNGTDPFAYDFHHDGGFEARDKQRTEDFEAKLRDNRNKLTILVALATILVGIVQVKTINKRSQKYIDQQREFTFRTQIDELNAKTNYGMGSMQDQRVARFLTTRQTGGYYNPYQGPGESQIPIAYTTSSGEPPPALEPPSATTNHGERAS